MANRKHRPGLETSTPQDEGPAGPADPVGSAGPAEPIVPMGPFDPHAHPAAEIYEIHVHGYLHHDWAEWLEGFEMRLLDNGEMILSGPIVDQSALLGVINKLSRLNLALLSINRVKQQSSETERNQEPNEYPTNLQP